MKTDYDPWACLSCGYKNHKVRLVWNEGEKTHICPCCNYKQDMLAMPGPPVGFTVPCFCTFQDPKPKEDKMSTLAEELAVLVVDRDSFTVGDKLEGQNKIDYEETVQHYAVVLQDGLDRFVSIHKRKKTLKMCWVCFKGGAETTGVVYHAMPGGLKCPPKTVDMHAKCKAAYTNRIAKQSNDGYTESDFVQGICWYCGRDGAEEIIAPNDQTFRFDQNRLIEIENSVLRAKAHHDCI